LRPHYLEAFKGRNRDALLYDYTSNIDSNQLRGTAANVGLRVSW
jgi:hypothetical protein